MRIISSKPPYINISVAILLCLVGIIIYSNTITGSFQFDDHDYIIENIAIKGLTNLNIIWDTWSTRFISFLSFALNYHFSGLNVAAYHITNLAIHIVTAFIVFWLMRLMLSILPINKDNKAVIFIPLLGALIFLTHPIQTESVVYIFQRTSLLAGFFYLLCLCLYLKYRISLQRPSLYILAFAAALLAMFSKENAVTLPLMIILLELYFFKPVRYRYILPFLLLLPLIPVLLFYTKPVTFIDVQTLMASPLHNGLSYLLTQPRVIVTYLRLLVIPINQNVDYDYPVAKSMLETPSLLSILFLGLILIGAIKLFKRDRLISFGIIWFFLTLLPESSIIPLKDIIFEHRLYLPLMGYALFFAGVIYYPLRNKSAMTMGVMILLIVAAYSILTYQRNTVWKDELALWSDTIRKSPQKARLYNSRGLAYFDTGKVDQAVSDYNRAIEIDPNLVDAYNNRGIAYGKTGKLDQALSEFTKAIEINPKHAKAYNNRGVVYFNKGNLDRAISDYNKAIEINPKDAELYNNRGVAYFYKKDYDKSWKDVHRAGELGYKVNPQFLAELRKASGREK